MPRLRSPRSLRISRMPVFESSAMGNSWRRSISTPSAPSRAAVSRAWRNGSRRLRVSTAILKLVTNIFLIAKDEWLFVSHVHFCGWTVNCHDRFAASPWPTLRSIEPQRTPRTQRIGMSSAILAESDSVHRSNIVSHTFLGDLCGLCGLLFRLSHWDKSALALG